MAVRWWYFNVVDGNIILETEFLDRPATAYPSGGDPHTPWYNRVSHADAEHAHVQAATERDARGLAMKLLRQQR